MAMANHNVTPKISKRLLWKTVAASDTDFLRRLIAFGLATADLSANHHGWTLVHEAVDRGNSGALLTLCAEIVGSVDKTSSSGIAPAHVAASRGDGLALVALKMLGADLTVLAADRARLRVAEREVAELQEQRDHIREAASGLAHAVGMTTTRERAALPEVAPERPTCCVCLSRAPDAAFLPCGHKVCCSDCALRIAGASSARRRECPICRASLTGALSIYES
jgi:hypothetical protein